MRQKKHPTGTVRPRPSCFDSGDADLPNPRIAPTRLYPEGCRCIAGATVSASIEKLPDC